VTIRFQWARADGEPDWHLGHQDFEPVWRNSYDLLRFHKGAGFDVERRPDGNTNTMKLREVDDFLEKQLKSHEADTKYIVKSKQDGWALAFRRHDVVDPAPKQLEMFGRSQIGDGYSLGAAGPSAWDCSGLTLGGVLNVTGILLPHKAGISPTVMPSQLHDKRILHIARAQLKPMDLLFHHGDAVACDHVSLYLDNDGPGGNGRVIDAEPHSTGAPSGWPTSQTGVGVQIRPMNPGYYTDWAHVVAIGRMVDINGKP
jgi:cell wall-associated NlpC family hydrolase